MKVYCKNCSHYLSDYPGDMDCSVESTFEFSPVFGKVKNRKYRSGYYTNNTYNCKDYERKFWKFWIKR
jgi:hypothetical protein